MSKSHKHITEDQREKPNNRTRKPESNTGAATEFANPAGFQEATEGSFSPIPLKGHPNTPSDAAEADDNLMSLSQPQQQQKPQPKPNPQQTK